MDRQPDVLQDRIEIITFHGRGVEPQERVGGQQNEQQECNGDPGLNREHIGFQRVGQIAPEQRHKP